MRAVLGLLAVLALASCGDLPPTSSSLEASPAQSPPAIPTAIAATAPAPSSRPTPTPPASPAPTATPTVPTTAPVEAPPGLDRSDPCAGGAVCLLNPAVTQLTIGRTICVAGWTTSVRPPATYTSALKAQQMAALRLPGTAADYEEDHRVPLELGGSPSSPQNLSPELRVAAGGSAELKDQDENAARAAVCAGSESLARAQSNFVVRWLTAWPGYRRP